MKFKNIYITILLLICAVKIEARQEQNSKASYTGIVVNADGTPEAGDTVTISYHHPYVPSRNAMLSARTITDNKGQFKLSIPTLTDPAKMRFNISYKGSSGFGRTAWFFFVSGDDVQIKIVMSKNRRIDSYSFSGKGSEKYAVRAALDKIAPDNSLGDFNRDFQKLGFMDSTGFEKKLEDYARLTQRYVEVKDSIIANAGLNDKMRRMVTYEYGNIYSEWTHRIYNFLKRYQKNSILNKMIRDNHYKYKKVFCYSPDSLMALCPRYLANTALEESRGIFITSSKSKITPIDLYHSYEAKYDGKLREKFISEFFLSGNGAISEMELNTKVIDSLMVDANKYITIPIIRSIWTPQLRLLNGQDAYNGVFTDLNGKNVSLSAFKGKVVFIDIWGIGCTACAKFHSRFHKEVYPKLKDNKDFVYLSINSDTTPERWNQGLKSNLYTADDYLNVHAGRLGMKHAFMKYYSIMGNPFLLLIDKNGKIFSSKIDSTPDVVYRLILNALGKKS